MEDERFARISENPIHRSVKFGKNVRIGENVVIDEGCSVGDGVFIGHNSVIRSGVSIGANSIIGHLVMVERDTTIGQKTTIQSQCHITAHAKIGDFVFIGPKAMCINTRRISHGRGFEAQPGRGPDCRYTRPGRNRLSVRAPPGRGQR